MITEDERFIKIQGILAFSDIHPNDCIKINDLIIDLSKQNQHLQSVIDKAIEYLKRKEKEPEWYDTDFMICINILNGGRGNFDEILRSKE